MNNPLISVVTVTYNAQRCLEQSLMSVINQTYKNIEYIIVDGCSTDGTLEIINKYSSKISKLVSEPDLGIYDAMNKALNLATGDYIIFLGADDHLLSWRTIEKVVPSLIDQNHVYYGQVFMEDYNLLHKGKFNKFKRARYNYCHQAIFYPRSVYKKYFYDLRFKMCADNYYNFQVGEKYQFVYINQTVSFFASGGVSGNHVDSEWIKIKDKIILSHCGFFAFLYYKLFSLLKN